MDYLGLEQKQNAQVEDRMLKEVCNPLIYNVQEKKLNHEKPDITFFGLSQEIKNAMPKILRLKDCLIFKKIFTDIARRINLGRQQNNTTELSIDEVATHVWPRSEVRWNIVCKKICDGSVSLKEIDLYFTDYYSSEEVLGRELSYLCAGERCGELVAQRLEEIRRYRRLQQCVQGANIVMKVKDELGLTGDFSILEQILGAVC